MRPAAVVIHKGNNMKQPVKATFAITAAIAALCAMAADKTVDIKLGAADSGHAVPSTLWGIFFEDINWAADGGIYPEQLANPGFDWKQVDREKWTCASEGWEPDFRNGGMARLSFQYGAPIHPNTAKHLRIEAFGKGMAGVRNRGLDGIFMEEGAKFKLSFYWRELALGGVDYELGDWKKFEAEFASAEKNVFDLPFGQVRIYDDKEAKDGRRILSILVTGRRTVEIEQASLMPCDTIAGLRRDLVEKLAALKPAFVRFPGGCIVEQGDFQHWYDWRRTVGPKERRECVINRWSYHLGPHPEQLYWQTFGLGYYEYFLLCEALGAEPLPISLAGITCQFQKPAQLAAVEDIDYFAQVILDLIEFANGDVNTKWGKVRADMGHPAPFNLKRVGIGNENWDQIFLDRYDAIQKIVKAKYPDIICVGSSGPNPDGRRFALAWNWYDDTKAELVDEHYYCDPKWFLASSKRYDGYARSGKPKVYAGEYACHDKEADKANNLWSAVCEAAAMTGFERNSDVVEMASYAPLFARIGHTQWKPDLIWFDGSKSFVTPNYYVQQMFSLNRPTRTISVEATADEADGFYACAGIDDTTGEKIVKIVNAGAAPLDVKMGVSGHAKVTTLTGDPKAVNTIDKETIRPEENELEFDGAITVPACSLTVIRVK